MLIFGLCVNGVPKVTYEDASIGANSQFLRQAIGWRVAEFLHPWLRFGAAVGLGALAIGLNLL
jgi:hypothetical protein